MMSIVSSRYDIARFGMERFRSSPRQADLLIVSGPRHAQDGRAAAPGLRPDARAEVGDRDGRLRELRRDVQQLHDPAGRRQDRPRRHPRARLPAATRGADGGDRAAAREDPRAASRPRTRSAESRSDGLRGRARRRRDARGVRRDDARRRSRPARRGVHAPARRARLQLPRRHRRGRLPRLGRAGGRRLHRDGRRPRPPRAWVAGSRARSRSEADSASRSRTTCSASPTSPSALRVQVWLDDGEAIASVDRRSGRPPTGSSARPGT